MSLEIAMSADKSDRGKGERVLQIELPREQIESQALWSAM